MNVFDYDAVTLTFDDPVTEEKISIDMRVVLVHHAAFDADDIAYPWLEVYDYDITSPKGNVTDEQIFNKLTDLYGAWGYSLERARG